MNGIMVFFIVIITIGLLLVAYGIKNKALAALLFGGGALLAPLLYLTELRFLMPMIPAVVMLILYFVEKKSILPKNK